jgi:hypothetical protein
MPRAVLPLFTTITLLLVGPTRAEELSPRERESIQKGLAYLAKTQYPDGHWEANGGRWSTSMTALAGMAFLMEGSTIRDGKYSRQVTRATDWFMTKAQANGLLGDPRNFSERSHYIHGHGYALLFLSQIYGEEEDAGRRRKLEAILTKAVEFSGNAQTSKGGWGYTSAKDSGDVDEGSTTITQLQGLRAARNAGIVVPKQIIDRGIEYLKKCTTPQGGIVYTISTPKQAGQERRPLTAAGVACMFSAGEYQHEYAKKWLKFCRDSIPIERGQPGLAEHWDYTQYYLAQTVYFLGENGYAKLFPKSKETERLTWSKYRAVMFEHIVGRQMGDGSWVMGGSFGNPGPVYSTACCLTILQLENNTLPIYQR